ncbi:hypothetical protein X797_011371 [Metarhizium robertsii]|uniref:VrtJ n=2 Tax=Metarhizium robertsii TaxID=568076 RepID=A0A0B2XH67_METRA|nr:VrtJ [Metarhizium robertsii ARSEF 23]EXU95534.1 hypothetical protein X797_011371 [Metarhizium robertsii]KHO10907.1 VrtJ [Metarhizium robertsii ARSEF 23]
MREVIHGQVSHIQEARVNRRDSPSGEAPEPNIYYPSGVLDVEVTTARWRILAMRCTWWSGDDKLGCGDGKYCRRPHCPKSATEETAEIRETGRYDVHAEAIVRALPKLRRRGPPPRKRIPQPSDASSTGGFPSKLVWSRETESASGDAHLAGVSSPKPLVQTACEEADQRPWKDDVVERRRPQRQGKENRHPGRDESPRKRSRRGTRGQRRRELQAEDLTSVLGYLEEEFAVKESLSEEQMWCTPIPHERKISTAEDFYRAFHDTSNLQLWTCMLCYRKRTKKELRDVKLEPWKLNGIANNGRSPFSCRSCMPEGESVLVCAECEHCLGRDALSPAARLHRRIGREHMFPEELTPVEEKLIALNSCYGFLTRYSVASGHKQNAIYPKHIKGHITVFPNNVQELATKVLPHPLMQVMEEIHISWQGAEKPAPSDLSGLLSVRRRVVERALVWLKMNNPHYAEIEIDAAEMESWGAPPYGVPSLVYDCMERNEPTAWEKARTAQVVPPTERGMDEEDSLEIKEVLARLNRGEDGDDGRTEGPGLSEDEGGLWNEAESGQSGKPINEVTSSAMFALNGPPDVHDMEKVLFACNVVNGDAAGRAKAGPTTRVESVERRTGLVNSCEPYIHVHRGEEFADSFDASFFAKTFPTLLPFGIGGPRLAEEATPSAGTGSDIRGVEAAAQDLVSSRNMSLRAWADIMLRRHGGRFATHHIFAFLVFNISVRSKNRRVSMFTQRPKWKCPSCGSAGNPCHCYVPLRASTTVEQKEYKGCSS